MSNKNIFYKHIFIDILCFDCATIYLYIPPHLLIDSNFKREQRSARKRELDEEGIRLINEKIDYL